MAGKAKAQPGFEDNMTQLEEIIRQLEGDKLTLEQSMEAYERGQALAKLLGDQLNAAETRLKTLTQSERKEQE